MNESDKLPKQSGRKHYYDKVTVLSTVYIVRQYLDTLSFSYYTILTVTVKQTAQYQSVDHNLEPSDQLTTPQSRVPSPECFKEVLYAGAFGNEALKFSTEKISQNDDTILAHSIRPSQPKYAVLVGDAVKIFEKGIYDSLNCYKVPGERFVTNFILMQYCQTVAGLLTACDIPHRHNACNTR